MNVQPSLTSSFKSASPSRRLKVLHCIGSLELGGEQRYLAQVVSRISPAKFEQVVAFGGNDESAAVHFPPSVPRIRVVESKQTATAISNWPSLVTYARLVTREKPDVLTTHGPGIFHLAASAAARAAGIPVVHTIQRPYGNRSRTENVIIRTPVVRQIAYHLSTRFVALGSYYAEDQIERWRIPADRIALNYIGIDLRDHRPDATLRAEGRRDLGLSDDDRALGIIARLVPVKGVDRGLRVFAAAASRNPRLKLVVVGGGPSRDDLVCLAEDLGVAERVLFAGPRSDTPKLLNAFDAFLQTTHNPLNGIASIEAMAAGKPVFTVVNRAEDERMAADTCRDGQNGGFVRLSDLDAAADMLAAVLDDPAKISAMGRASRTLAERLFDIDRHVAVLEQLYATLVAEAAAHSRRT